VKISHSTAQLAMIGSSVYLCLSFTGDISQLPVMSAKEVSVKELPMRSCFCI